MNPGHTIFKRAQRLQGGEEDVPLAGRAARKVQDLSISALRNLPEWLKGPIRHGVGRVATNVIAPFDYTNESSDRNSKFEEIAKLFSPEKLRHTVESIAKDQPAYKAEELDLSDTYGEQSLEAGRPLFREYFDLPTQDVDNIFIKNGKDYRINPETKNQTAQDQLTAYRKDLALGADQGQNSAFLGGHYFPGQPDPWDFDLRSYEEEEFKGKPLPIQYYGRKLLETIGKPAVLQTGKYYYNPPPQEDIDVAQNTGGGLARGTSNVGSNIFKNAQRLQGGTGQVPNPEGYKRDDVFFDPKYGKLDSSEAAGLYDPGEYVPPQDDEQGHDDLAKSVIGDWKPDSYKTIGVQINGKEIEIPQWGGQTPNEAEEMARMKLEWNLDPFATDEELEKVQNVAHMGPDDATMDPESPNYTGNPGYAGGEEDVEAELGRRRPRRPLTKKELENEDPLLRDIIKSIPWGDRFKGPQVNPRDVPVWAEPGDALRYYHPEYSASEDQELLAQRGTSNVGSNIFKNAQRMQSGMQVVNNLGFDPSKPTYGFGSGEPTRRGFDYAGNIVGNFFGPGVGWGLGKLSRGIWHMIQNMQMRNATPQQIQQAVQQVVQQQQQQQGDDGTGTSAPTGTAPTTQDKPPPSAGVGIDPWGNPADPGEWWSNDFGRWNTDQYGTTPGNYNLAGPGGQFGARGLNFSAQSNIGGSGTVGNFATAIGFDGPFGGGISAGDTSRFRGQAGYSHPYTEAQYNTPVSHFGWGGGPNYQGLQGATPRASYEQYLAGFHAPGTVGSSTGPGGAAVGGTGGPQGGMKQFIGHTPRRAAFAMGTSSVNSGSKLFHAQQKRKKQ